MTKTPASTESYIPLSRLAGRAAVDILLMPDAAMRRALADELGLLDLRKLRLAGTLEPADRADWLFRGTMGATVIQPCSVTLAPVTTRLDEPLTRRFVAEPEREPQTVEQEIPEDVDQEPLGSGIDLLALLIEELALSLPAYPKAPGATFSPPDSDDDEPAEKPFAGLAALRKSMSEDGD